MGIFLKYLGIILMMVFTILFFYALQQYVNHGGNNYEYLVPNITALFGIGISGILMGIGKIVEKKYVKI